MHDETAGTGRPEPDLLARHVRERRRECGLSVPQVAEAAELSEAWITAIERGAASADRTSLSRLAAVLHTTVGRLVAPDDTYAPAPLPDAPGADAAPADTRARGMTDMAEDECFARLALHSVGRVSPASCDRPFVLPVNYVLDERDIVFRTTPDSSLAEVEGPVAFEVDDLLQSARLGWSVLVTGEAERLTDETETRRLATRAPEPWPGGERPVWIRIRPKRVTGRRVSPRTPPV
ncbi:MAG TPA: pyridoxamine 5'-phosphate oxidase family protein [Yinghuangia sp.]|nr:pyridoxamine 5'-phosphate oxidase family protein [Yinghuangia sp.]